MSNRTGRAGRAARGISAFTWVVLLALGVGCTSQSKSNRGPQPAAEPAASKAAPAQPGAQAGQQVAPAPAQPAPAAEKQVVAAEPAPTGNREARPAAEPRPQVQPVSQQQGEEPQVVPADMKVETEADREKLAKMIMDAVLAQQKARGQEPGTPPPAQPAPVKPVPPAKPANAAATQPTATSQPAEESKGCGGGSSGSTIDLTPPAPDQPQPKFVINQMKCEAKPVWRGTPVEFTFEVTNAGEGPLAVRMKGG